MQEKASINRGENEVRITLGRPLTVSIRFTMYELRVVHRLLNNLQAVSRFLLRSLAAGLAMETIVEVTAFSRHTLEAQIEYLQHQGYVEQDGSLSAMGSELVEMEACLPSLVVTVGIDNLSGKCVFVVPAEHVHAPDDLRADAAIPDERSITYFVHQRELAAILLGDNNAGLLRFIQYFWPDHAALLERHLRYLDYSLSRTLDQRAGEVAISMPSEQLRSVPSLSNDEIGAVLPVLAIQRSYARAEGYPWTVRLPSSDRTRVELFSNTVMPPAALCGTESPDERRLVRIDSPAADSPVMYPAEIPMGATVHYEIERMYASLRFEGSLMQSVRERYGYLVLGDSHVG